jgi:hypothetical protein
MISLIPDLISCSTRSNMSSVIGIHSYNQQDENDKIFLLIFLILAHLNYVKQLIGVDFVGIGAGFDDLAFRNS